VLSIKIEQIDLKVEIDLDLSGFMDTSDHSNGGYKQVRLEIVVQGEASADQVISL
jgi:hypothetical protein